MLSGVVRWGPVLGRGLVLCLFRLIGVFPYFLPSFLGYGEICSPANNTGTGRGKHTRSLSLPGRIWALRLDR